MRIRSWVLVFLVCLLCAGILSGCGSSSPAQVNVEDLVIIDPTATFTPEPTDPPPTPTDPPSEPTATMVKPTETPEPVPELSSHLTGDGPWLVYAAVDGVYAMNIDGSGLTKLYANGADSDVESIQIVAPPQGGKIAVLQVDAQERFQLGMPRLKTILLPDGYLVLDTWLIPYEWEMETYVGKFEDMTDQERTDFYMKMPLEQMFAAIGEWNEIAWSSDGSLLAFNAVFDGTSADLYLYNDDTLKITRLTDGPAHSVDPVFTPDDANILHGAVNHLNWGMSGGGYDYLSVWAANVHTKEVEKVFDHQYFGWERVLGWLNDTAYVAVSQHQWCGFFDLRMMDITKGQQKMLYGGHHSGVAVAADSGRAMFSVLNYGSGGECKSEFDPGVYLMDTNYKNTTLIPEIDPESVIEIQYNPVSDAFYVSDRTGKFHVVQMDGSVQSFDALEKEFETYISPDGTRWAFWKKYSDMIAVGDLEGLFDVGEIDNPGDPLWLPDSSVVLFVAEAYKDYFSLARISFPGEGEDEAHLEWLVEDIPEPYGTDAPMVLVNP